MDDSPKSNRPAPTHSLNRDTHQEATSDFNQDNQTSSSQTPPYREFSEELTRFIAARVELASLEAREAMEFSIKKAVHGVLLALLALFTWALFLAAITGFLSPVIDSWLGNHSFIPSWGIITLALAVIHGAGGVFFFKQLQKKPSSPLFELSLKEIKHDKQWLTKNK